MKLHVRVINVTIRNIAFMHANANAMSETKPGKPLVLFLRSNTILKIYRFTLFIFFFFYSFFLILQF